MTAVLVSLVVVILVMGWCFVAVVRSLAKEAAGEFEPNYFQVSFRTLCHMRLEPCGNATADEVREVERVDAELQRHIVDNGWLHNGPVLVRIGRPVKEGS